MDETGADVTISKEELQYKIKGLTPQVFHASITENIHLYIIRFRIKKKSILITKWQLTRKKSF